MLKRQYMHEQDFDKVTNTHTHEHLLVDNNNNYNLQMHELVYERGRFVFMDNVGAINRNGSSLSLFSSVFFLYIFFPIRKVNILIKL